MGRPTEATTSAEVIAALRKQGWTTRKVDDRYGGLPDHLVGQPHRQFWVEFKLVRRYPPFTPRQLKLRRGQAAFFRTWPAEAFLAACIVDVGWFVGLSPDHSRWTLVTSAAEAARALIEPDGIANIGRAAWLLTPEDTAPAGWNTLQNVR